MEEESNNLDISENDNYTEEKENNENINNKETKEILEENIEIQEQEQEKEKEETENEKLKKENNNLLDKFQRTLAEFDNFRKRTAKEKANMYDDGVRDTVEKVLSILDNFERALLSINDKENNIYIGLKMVYKQFEDVLSDLGVDQIKCKGEKFDPKLHFAVSHEEDKLYGENEIIEELQKGYKYKGKVIRCSMVKVAN